MTTTYTVKSGDSLSLISKKFYGDFSMVQDIATRNNIRNLNLIQPGMTLTIATPKVQEAQVVETVLATSEDTKKKLGTYFVWGFGLLAVGLLTYEASKQHKKNKAASKPKEALSGKKVSKMSKQEAKRTAEKYGVDFSKDFHEATSSEKEVLIDLAKKVGYRKPKSASGSTARYFFDYLDKTK